MARGTQPNTMIVHCGDLQGHFSFGTRWSTKALGEKLTQLKKRFEFVPGLVFKDAGGRYWRPVLEVSLEQVLNPEEKT